MSNRQVFSRSRLSAGQLGSLVSSLFALELLAPSRSIYLLSPWVTDFPVIKSGTVDLRVLLPDRGDGDAWLSTILTRLSERGSAVRLVCRPNQPATDEFLRRLPPTIDIRMSADLHAKELVTDHAALIGSMNFTYAGLYLNDETIELKTAPEDVASAHLKSEQYWTSLSL